MAEISTMLALGTKAPDFQLLDTVSDQYLSLQELKSDKATVIMFICNHCPYVRYIEPILLALIETYQKKGIHFIGISSNDATTHPEDGPTQMKSEAQRLQYTFPYLYDATQDVAKAYHAACTPDFYIFDENLYCVYRGRFDDATPRNQIRVTGKDLKEALDHILKNEPVAPDQKPSIGCGIKWKK